MIRNDVERGPRRMHRLRLYTGIRAVSCQRADVRGPGRTSARS